MTSGKRLTIGVTVNLERYENLRVAVEGDVDSLEDAQNLASYLDGVLAGLGKNDPETEKQIANYRFRVLSGKIDGADDEVQPEPKPLVAPKPDVPPKIPLQSNTDTKKEAPSPVCAPPATGIAETGLFCADCGVTISTQEHKLGRLFVDRPLCKACLQTLQKAQH